MFIPYYLKHSIVIKVKKQNQLTRQCEDKLKKKKFETNQNTTC